MFPLTLGPFTTLNHPGTSSGSVDDRVPTPECRRFGVWTTVPSVTPKGVVSAEEVGETLTPALTLTGPEIPSPRHEHRVRVQWKLFPSFPGPLLRKKSVTHWTVLEDDLDCLHRRGGSVGFCLYDILQGCQGPGERTSKTSMEGLRPRHPLPLRSPWVSTQTSGSGTPVWTPRG